MPRTAKLLLDVDYAMHERLAAHRMVSVLSPRMCKLIDGFTDVMLNLIGFLFSLFGLLVFGGIYYTAFGPGGVVVAVIAFILVLPLHYRWLDKRKR